MKIILANGVELFPLVITGDKRYVNGAQRDTLSFAFPAEMSLDELDAIFSAENCAKITIVEPTTIIENEVEVPSEIEHIHKGYTVRAELKREPVEVSPATAESDAVYENRVTVSMSQMTYAEQQLAALAEQNAVLEECIVEMAQVVYA